MRLRSRVAITPQIDFARYPHIVDYIVDCVRSGSTIKDLRLTSRHFRDKIDAVVFKHLTVCGRNDSITTHIRSSNTVPLQLRFEWTRLIVEFGWRDILAPEPPDDMRRPGSLGRYTKVLDMFDGLASHCMHHVLPVLDVVRVCDGVNTFIPRARTLILFDSRCINVNLRQIKTLVVRPVLGKLHYYKVSDNVRWLQSGVVDDLVIIGRVAEWYVSEFAHDIVNLMQMYREKMIFKRITFVDIGIDMELVFRALDYGYCKQCRKKDAGWLKRLRNDIQWKSVTREEYANGLNDEDKLLQLDELEHSFVTACKAYAAKLKIDFDEHKRAANVFEYDCPTESDKERYYSVQDNLLDLKYIRCPCCRIGTPRS